MTEISIYPVVKDREKLTEDVNAFLDAGGKITVLPSNEIRYKKEQVVRRGLHYTVHLKRISQDTGIPQVQLKSLKRSLVSITDCTLNTLYEYFSGRDLSKT